MSANTEPVTGDGGAIYHADTDDEQTPAVADISTVGTAVTGGVGVLFQTEFPNFATTQPTFIVAQLSDGTNEARLVTAVASETACTIGTAFTDDLPASTAYTYVECNKIPFVMEASGPSRSRNIVDASHLGSGAYDSKVPGSIVPGAISFPIHLVGANAEHQEILTRFESGAIFPYVIFRKDATIPVAVPSLNNGRIYFRAFLGESPYTQARNETNKINFTLEVDGKTVFEQGT